MYSLYINFPHDLWGKKEIIVLVGHGILLEEGTQIIGV